MADTLKARVGRIVAGGVAAIVSSMEDAAPDMVLEQAIREVEASIEEARAELGRAIAARHLAAKQLAEKNTQHDKLTDNLGFAVEQNRDDLAEAAIAAQLDIEAQIPVIEQAIAGAAEDEREFSGYVAALDAKRREMEAELKAFRERQNMARGHAAGAPGGVADAARKANLAEQAFARVLAREGLPSGLSGADAKTAAQLAELDQLMRRNRIQERLAQMKSGRKA